MYFCQSVTLQRDGNKKIQVGSVGLRYIYLHIYVIDIILLYSKENKIMIHHREYLVLFLLRENKNILMYLLSR